MSFPPQHQDHQPGIEALMEPAPRSFMQDYKAAGKLKAKRALITGGDSGIGRAVAIGFAMEGADIAIIYLEEDKDATITKDHIEKQGRTALLLKGDIGNKAFCEEAVKRAAAEFGGLDILVNNAAEHYPQQELQGISEEQLRRTFETNLFSAFFLTQAALPYLKEGAAIINTASVVGFRGHESLIDYAATKGAILAFTRSLASNLASKGIRVNAVAPGPIWTPLIPSSFDAEKVQHFGEDTLLGRAGQPDEVAPSFIFLASSDASYITGQTIHPNGGSIVGA